MPYSCRSHLPATERRDGVGDPAVERNDEPEDELGHRRGVATWAVGHVDAPPAGRADVDRRELGARPHDEVELLGAVNRRGGHFRGADDQDPDAREPGLQALSRQLGLVDHLEWQRAKLFDRTRVKLVGDEQSHVLEAVC